MGRNIKNNLSENTSGRRVFCLLGAMIILFGGSVILKESAGYEVTYEGTTVGFVGSPAEVLDNMDPICVNLSEKIRMQAALTADQFDFEKKVRVFKSKDDWQDVAEKTGENCQVEVNVYALTVDDVPVVQTNDIQTIDDAMKQITEDYREANPEEKSGQIGFAENTLYTVSRGKPVEETDPQEMAETLKENLTVETVERSYKQEAIPYEVLYEETETRPLGEQSVKVNGVEGTKVI